MNAAYFRRLALSLGIAFILGLAVIGTVNQRRGLADYDHARHEVRSALAAYENVLVAGETRARAVANLRAAGAAIDSQSGDIVVTVLRELNASATCRSLVGELHVAIDTHGRVAAWQTPKIDAECG